MYYRSREHWRLTIIWMLCVTYLLTSTKWSHRKRCWQLLISELSTGCHGFAYSNLINHFLNWFYWSIYILRNLTSGSNSFMDIKVLLPFTLFSSLFGRIIIVRIFEYVGFKRCDLVSSSVISLWRSLDTHMSSLWLLRFHIPFVKEGFWRHHSM